MHASDGKNGPPCWAADVTGVLSLSNSSVRAQDELRGPGRQIHDPQWKIRKEHRFIAALFVIARTWKQPRCPSADEWIRKQWYIYTMEYYSAVKKNSFESVLNDISKITLRKK